LPIESAAAQPSVALMENFGPVSGLKSFQTFAFPVSQWQLKICAEVSNSYYDLTVAGAA
jgi:hypothetical protein